MSINLEQFLPAARPWVENLVNVWPTPYVKPNFAFWEVGHVLSLIALGGATILMNLRLIGVGLTQEPPSEIFRNLRVVQTAGVVGIVLTGVLIGMANAERLYDSAAFIVKMLGLIGGLILTYGVSRPVPDRIRWRRLLADIIQLLEERKFEDMCRNKNLIGESIRLMKETTGGAL